MAETNLAQALLTETDVSKQLRVSLAALRKWHVVNRGLQFLKVGSLVRYRQDDIDHWLVGWPSRAGHNYLRDVEMFSNLRDVSRVQINFVRGCRLRLTVAG